MTQELSIRVKALIEDLFFFDKPRAIIITDEVTGILSKEGDQGTNWDRMDGLRFTRFVYRALGTLEAENPSLFL